MIILHGVKLSGHVHRVELMLRMLSLPYEFRTPPADERGRAEFLGMNPLGQVPVLQDGDVTLADSNAILVYLVRRYAPGSPWLPAGAVAEATVQRWLSIAAGEVFIGPGSARLAHVFGVDVDVPRARAMAQRLLTFMDQHLGQRAFLAAEHETIADLACYSYVAHAPEGGVRLEPFPAVRAWLARVEALPQFFSMPRSPEPAA